MRARRRRHAAAVLACALALGAQVDVAAAATPDSTAGSATRPFVVGGYDDRPYLSGVFGNIRVGGYIEGNGVLERESGVTDELGFELTRLSLLTSTDLRRRVQVWTEIEFEEGGEEVELELVQVDFLVHRALNFRGGVLLLPLGHFNLAHDGPRTELPERPLVATDLLGSALSQPGLGVFGTAGIGRAGQLAYEAYAVTGYDDGLLSSDGTRLPAGSANFEDANNSPAGVARLEWAPAEHHRLEVSGYAGAYNVHRVEGVEVAPRHDVRVGVADIDTRVGGLRLIGEAAIVEVDVPPDLTGVYASRQSGAYFEASLPFGSGWVGQQSWFTGVVRLDGVDFDRDVAGDSIRSVTVGFNLRPIPESCIKLAYERSEIRDRFNNPTPAATLALGIASYF